MKNEKSPAFFIEKAGTVYGDMKANSLLEHPLCGLHPAETRGLTVFLTHQSDFGQ